MKTRSATGTPNSTNCVRFTDDNVNAKNESTNIIVLDDDTNKRKHAPANGSCRCCLTKQQIGDSYPWKKLRACDHLNIYDGQLPVLDTVKDPPYLVYAKDVAFGMITLFFVRNFTDELEGDVYPIIKAHGMISPDDINRQFVSDVSFVMISPLRTSKINPTPVIKPYKSYNRNKEFREVVFVKAFKDNTSVNKQRIVAKLVQFLRDNGVDAEAKSDVDQTNHDVQPLDNYLMDLDICRFIHRYYKGKADKDFYNNNPQIRDAFFSRPYPEIAQEQFGYPPENTAD